MSFPFFSFFLREICRQLSDKIIFQLCISLSLAGKCYNVVEETFLFNQDREASITRTEKSLPGPARKAAAATATEAEQVSEPSSVEHRNIPAILPYEVKEALLRDMREGDSKAAKETAEKRQVTQVREK